MNNFFEDMSKSIVSLNRYSKRVIAVLTDFSLCIFCTWLALVLRLEELIIFKDFNFYPAIISIIIGLPIFWLFGLYRTIFRYTGSSIIFTISVSTLVYGLLYFLVIGIYGIQTIPRSIGVIQPMILFFAIIISRLGVKFIIGNHIHKGKVASKKNVLIYGAGDAGRQLLVALENSSEFKIKGFLDDNKQLHGQVLLGKKIYLPFKLERLINNYDIKLVFLAIPSISRSERNQIIKKLNDQKLIVKTLPTISEIVDGRITVSDIKDLNIEDLLDREEIKPDKKLLNKNVNSKTVIVTGAGGSIGSEICRQILKLNPYKLILLELNEFALYKIYEDLVSYNKNFEIIPLLGNTQDQKKLEMIFEVFKVDTIYHSAAYKHVPLVESNICEGVRNNVFSTLAVANAAVNKKISNLVLISSDKAVRPTNIMGATKRLSELCMQAIHANFKDIDINFSIVRFGNVLESSGSVIPKFKKQIKKGGPVTLTHKNVTRYFMSVTEAAQLVIQAGAMGKNCEVFVLDMGESIKIENLINKMINFFGFTVKNSENPDGDIEIKTIGLRPGEKLYEELLIGENPEDTTHPKIQKARDVYIFFDQLKVYLDNLKKLIEENKVDEVKNELNRVVKSYKSNTKIVDHIYLNQFLFSEKKKNNLIKIK
jgi:FlaA1/EpsC-like NDP-sugar epimerase